MGEPESQNHRFLASGAAVGGGTTPPTIDSIVPALTAPDLSSPTQWSNVILSCNPASLIVFIESRLGDLATSCSSADILQDALLRAWEARSTVQWRGHRAFRSWLIAIIDHCISDSRDWHNAAKRGGGKPNLGFFEGNRGMELEPFGSTTPSRLAQHHEQAAIMKRALADLPEDVREVTQLRLFEQQTLQQIAERLGMPFTTVQHRARRGAMLYRDRLHSALAMSSFKAQGMMRSSAQSPIHPPPAPKTADDSVY